MITLTWFSAAPLGLHVGNVQGATLVSQEVVHGDFVLQVTPTRPPHTLR